MLNTNEEKLLLYSFEKLVNNNQLEQFAKSVGFSKRLVGNKKNKIETLQNDASHKFTLDEFGKFSKSQWSRPNTRLHTSNLTSGILKGHSWHGARPSTLQFLLQNKVREVCDGRATLKDMINIGGELAKHEYFIVAVHDLSEDLIIAKFGAIPAIKSKSVTDFIFKKIPYDLKNTPVPRGWAFNKAKTDPQAFVKDLYINADTERIRKQAVGSIENWGYNRFYVVIQDDSEWLSNPNKVLSKLEKQVKKLSDPLEIIIEGRKILCQVTFISTV